MTSKDYLDWKAYHEIAQDQFLFRQEATDFVARLNRHVPLSKDWTVFDFGCGFGHVSNALADKIKEIYMWDDSNNMRSTAVNNVGHHKNVILIDAASSEDFQVQTDFDLILVNSVLQYMSSDEFSTWLMKWRSLLKPEGKIIISDIIPHKVSPLLDLTSLLFFCLRKGIIIQAVKEGYRMLNDWLRTKNVLPLQYYSREDIGQNAEDAGFVVRLYDRNLTYRQSRFSVELSKS
jgi:2-polyprenyl-3-methyl-5-hydroxy-6-metoxy-1,4-benzoquinol methylase